MRHYLVLQAGDDVEVAWQYPMVFDGRGLPVDYTPTTKVVYTAPPKPVAEARHEKERSQS